MPYSALNACFLSLFLSLCFFITDELKPFWCYNISVYPMLQDQVGEPYSIQAYVKEGSMYGQGPMGKRKHWGLPNIQTRLWTPVVHSQLS